MFTGPPHNEGAANSKWTYIVGRLAGQLALSYHDLGVVFQDAGRTARQKRENMELYKKTADVSYISMFSCSLSSVTHTRTPNQWGVSYVHCCSHQQTHKQMHTHTRTQGPLTLLCYTWYFSSVHMPFSWIFHQPIIISCAIWMCLCSSQRDTGKSKNKDGKKK